MKPLTPITKFKEGLSIQGFYLCTEKYQRHTRNGDLYLDLVLRDLTGHLPAKIWDKVAQLNDFFSAGDAVAVSGVVEFYQERPQLIVKKIKKATVQNYGRYGFDPALVVPSSKKDPQKMWSEITDIIKIMKNPFLQKLVSGLYKKHKKLLMVHPASVTMHHNFRSGFVEHNLSMARIAKKISPEYKVDRDLLLAGVLLHDIGKLREINSEYTADFTDQGNLIGHITLGRDMVREAITKIKNFPDALAMKVEHMILSHQGRYDWQSPKKPKFREALLVHLIDNLDAKMNLMEMALEDDQQEGRFTTRHNYFRIPLLKDDEPE